MIPREIMQSVRGAAIVKEWLGEDATPVSQTLAESRSDVCVKCEFNVAGNWWQNMVNAPIAIRIKNHLAIKNHCCMVVPEERFLHTCKVCDCCLPLAVWCPIHHLATKQTKSELTKYPAHCWKRKEIEELQ